MKITNLRRDSLNSMTLEINCQKFRIHGEAGISLHEARKSIPTALKDSATLAEVSENLAFFDLKLVAAK
jgi:hypothetical protein